MIQKILQLLLPKNCPICKRPHQGLCTNCQQQLKFHPNDSCPGCSRHSPNGYYCKYCKPNTPLTGVFIAGDNRQFELQTAVYHLKYKGHQSIGKQLGIFMNLALERNHQLKNIFHYTSPPGMIIYQNTKIIALKIPRSEQRQRGYNQNILIAKAIKKSKIKANEKTAIIIADTLINLQQANIDQKIKNTWGLVIQ